MTANGIMWETPFISAVYSVIPISGVEVSSASASSWLAAWVNVAALSALEMSSFGDLMASPTPVATSGLPMTIASAFLMYSAVKCPSTPMEPWV